MAKRRREFGSSNLICGPTDVRFTPESGHQLSTRRCPLIANSGHGARAIACQAAAPLLGRFSTGLRLGALLEAFSPQECANYFANAGYASE